MINWYKIPRNKGKQLMLIIASSNNQRKLTAGGMMELTLRSFGNVNILNIQLTNYILIQ